MRGLGKNIFPKTVPQHMQGDFDLLIVDQDLDKAD